LFSKILNWVKRVFNYLMVFVVVKPVAQGVAKTGTIPAQQWTSGVTISTVDLSQYFTGSVTSYGIAPALPTGVNLNTSTGAITGTPSVTLTQTAYTVTAQPGDVAHDPFNITVSAAVGSQAYIAAMSPLSINSLTTVNNGVNNWKTLLLNDTADWGLDSAADENGVHDFSGGIGVPEFKTVYYNGGGHAAPEAGFNGIVGFDYSGDAQAEGFILEPGSWSTAANATGGVTNADGRPGAVHTYTGMQYDPTDNTIYRFGGAINPTGSGSTNIWGFNLDTGSWTDYGAWGGSTDLSIATFFDLATRKMLCIIGGVLSYRVFDCAAKTWLGGGISFFGNPSPPIHCVSTWIPTQQWGYVFAQTGASQPNQIKVDWDTSNDSVSTSSLVGVTTGDTEITDTSYGAATTWDDELDCLWSYEMSNYPNALFQFVPTATGGAWTRYTLTGTPPLSGDYKGSYGRLVNLEGQEALGFFGRRNDTAKVIRKPSGLMTADQDWINRSTGPGVIRADRIADAQVVADRKIGSQDAYVTWDTTHAASGAGSCRIEIPTNSGAASSDIRWNFSDDGTVRRGANTEFYVQWRQRFSQSMLDTLYDYTAGNGGWKQMNISQGDVETNPSWDYPNELFPGFGEVSSLQPLEIVVNNAGFRFMPSMYHSSLAFDRFQEPYSGDFKYQNAIDAGVGVTPDSSRFVLWSVEPTNVTQLRSLNPGVGYFPDEWMTFQIRLKVGPLGTDTDFWGGGSKSGFINSEMEMWVARDGQPSVLVHSYTVANGLDFVLRRGDGATPSDEEYGKVWFTPFHTAKDPAQTHPSGFTWYDELIISDNKIPDPQVAGDR
jgi:hypothetical protein